MNGYHGDCSEMYRVGSVDAEADRLIDVTEQCLSKAIGICKPNERFCNIGNVVEETATKNGFAVIPVFAGHGIGSYFHGLPDILNFGKIIFDLTYTFLMSTIIFVFFGTANNFEGVMLPGMTFTIEPLITQGKPEVAILEDGWTAVTMDGARTAQIEHTVLITDHGCSVLTC